MVLIAKASRSLSGFSSSEKKKRKTILRCLTWLWKTQSSLKYCREMSRQAGWKYQQILRKRWLLRWMTKKGKCWTSSRRPKSYAKIWKGNSRVTWWRDGIEPRSWFSLKKTTGQQSTCGPSVAFSVRCWAWWKSQRRPTSIASLFSLGNLASHYHLIELLVFRRTDFQLLKTTSSQ